MANSRSNIKEEVNNNIAINLSDSSDDGIDDDAGMNDDIGSDEEAGLNLAGQIDNTHFKSKNIFASDLKQNEQR